MLLRRWEDIPIEMQCREVREYYDILSHRRSGLVIKRIFDIVVSSAMIVILSPLLLAIAVLVAVSSPGGVFFRQVRVTSYGKKFRIFKFRTMVDGAEMLGNQVTVNNDSRVTGIGKILRNLRLDEIPQLFNILSGDMTFVGTRPEVPGYVEKYTKEMLATLLLPAGVTSKASIFFKDESRLLDGAEDVDKVYIEKVLPGKMFYNLHSIKQFSFTREIGIMLQTVLAVLKK